MNISEWEGDERTFYTLEMEADDMVVCHFNYMSPRSGEATRADGSTFTWYKWSIGCTINKQTYEYMSLFVPEWFSQVIEDHLRRTVQDDADVRDYEWKITRPPMKNKRTKRYYTGWKIEPFVTLKETQTEIIDIDEMSDEGYEASDTNLALTEIEFALLYRIANTKAYGEEKVKRYLIKNLPTTNEERIEGLVDVMVDDDGYVDKDLVEKYGERWTR